MHSASTTAPPLAPCFERCVPNLEPNSSSSTLAFEYRTIRCQGPEGNATNLRCSENLKSHLSHPKGWGSWFFRNIRIFNTTQYQYRSQNKCHNLIAKNDKTIRDKARPNYLSINNNRNEICAPLRCYTAFTDPWNGIYRWCRKVGK
jgi:hypothetical protein